MSAGTKNKQRTDTMKLSNLIENKSMEQYANLIDAINGLRKEGYTEDFNLQQQCLECRDRQFRIFHDEFIVDKYFRFDVSSDAADQSIIYAISSEKHALKGILINAYGIYSEPVTNEMLNKLNIAE
jgi:hypothetical protein